MSNKNSYLNNPLAGKDPLSQYLLFKNNIEELQKNINIIVNLAKPLISFGLTNGCEISKAISDKICLVTGVVGSQINTFDLKNNPIYKNLKKTAEQVQNKISDFVPEVTPSNSNNNNPSTLIPDKIADVVSKVTPPNSINLSNINNPSTLIPDKISDVVSKVTPSKPKPQAKSTLKQSGGYKNNYNYIKDPINNKYISIHSKKGIKIIKKYINTII